MKKIKFLIFLLALSSCNQYLGTVDPDYTPTNEVTEIFSDLDKNKLRSQVKFGDIIFPKAVNPSLNINTLEIEKIIKANKNSIVNFLNEKIIVSKDNSIYLIDKNNQNKFEYELNLSKNEKTISIFKFNEDIHILTNRSRIFVINSQNIFELADYDIFINTAPIVLEKNLILLSVFGEIYNVKLDDYSISKKDNFILKPGITIKSNIFEDNTNSYYLFNAGTLLTFDKNNFDYYTNYILEDLNILTSLDELSELVDSPFSYDEYLYFLDRSGKIVVFNPISSDIFWELDINETILSYLFSNDGYLILMTLNKILIISDNGNIINSYSHNKKLPISIFNIQENIYLISEQGISKLNLKDKKDDIFIKNKFTNNLEIFFQDETIYLKDDKSLFKLSE
tara:strand:+ start:1022 stop:2206 length:1185 start_codon:yes stop_codon:yes gene_type:complete